MKFKKNIIVLVFLGTIFSQDWKIQIQVEINAWDGNFDFPADTENYLGVDYTATDGYDSGGIDIPEPQPSPGNHIRFYFPHPEWETNFSTLFAQDIKLNESILSTETGKTWNAEMYSNTFGETLITLELSEDFPNCDYSLLLDSNEYFNVIEINTELNANEIKEIEIKVYNCEELNKENVFIPQKLDIQIFPNPFNGNATIEYNIINTIESKINIYNIIGEKVLLETKINKTGNKKQLKINSKQLKSGIYFIEVENNRKIERKKFTILK